MTLQPIYRFLSLKIWGNLPSNLQRRISSFYAEIYNRSFSKLIIRPYCKFNYRDQAYLNQFRSESGRDDYQSFQDFFTRVYKKLPKATSAFTWPCEGLLCDYGKVSEFSEVNIKGDRRNVRTIFGRFGDEVAEQYYFSNVFLHNNNYHRIHAPVTGVIKGIELIKGDLVLLRPWIYKNDPSLPAMRNERINIKIEDETGRPWFLSIVGGPAVGTIVLDKKVCVDSKINIIEQLGLFLLGSTCCMAAPVGCNNKKGDQVYVGGVYC